LIFGKKNPTHVKKVLETLDVNEATDQDGISSNIMKAGA